MIAATLVGEVLLAAMAAWLFMRRRPQWPLRRIALFSALPIPMIIWALCIFVFVGAATASAEECGVDACGMAIAATMFMGMAAFGVFVLGVVVAYIVARKASRATGPDLSEVFK